MRRKKKAVIHATFHNPLASNIKQKGYIMKTNLFIAGIISTFIIINATSCSNGTTIIASKNYITKEIKTGNFQNIESIGSMDVVYIQGEKPRIEIYGPDNVVPMIMTNIENNKLTINYKNNINIVNLDKLEVKVITNDLNKVRINGSGDFSLPNGITHNHGLDLVVNGSGDVNGKMLHVKKLYVNINGSGDADLRDIKSEICSAHIIGSGDVALSGVTGNADFEVAGSGDINATALQTKNVKAGTFGSGNISCYATGILVGNIAGSGNIIYKGNPKKIDFPLKKSHKTN